MNGDLGAAVSAMLAERAQERAAEWQRRRDARVAFRAEKQVRRDAGLKVRHAQKLGRKAA